MNAGRKKTLQCYQDMKQRCLNPNSQQYKNYGARGIRICDRWLESVDNFVSDMGNKPEGYTLERINNDGNYSPENCRWATRKEQRANQRTTTLITFNGETKPLREFAKQLSIHETTIHGRLKRGMTVEEALTTPVDPVRSMCGKIGLAVKWPAIAAAKEKK